MFLKFGKERIIVSIDQNDFVNIFYPEILHACKDFEITIPQAKEMALEFYEDWSNAPKSLTRTPYTRPRKLKLKGSGILKIVAVSVQDGEFRASKFLTKEEYVEQYGELNHYDDVKYAEIMSGRDFLD
jgi:hypothetical protein